MLAGALGVGTLDALLERSLLSFGFGRFAGRFRAGGLFTHWLRLLAMFWRSLIRFAFNKSFAVIGSQQQLFQLVAERITPCLCLLTPLGALDTKKPQLVLGL